MRVYVNQLPQNKQKAILRKVRKHYKQELHQEFTDEDKETLLNSRVCDLAEVL